MLNVPLLLPEVHLLIAFIKFEKVLVDVACLRVGLLQDQSLLFQAPELLLESCEIDRSVLLIGLQHLLLVNVGLSLPWVGELHKFQDSPVFLLSLVAL